MIKIVGVRFKNAGKIYYFDPVELEVEKSIDVVVETARGLEYGTVVVGPKEIDESELVSPLKPIIRIATDEDRQVYLENKEKKERGNQEPVQRKKERPANRLTYMEKKELAELEKTMPVLEEEVKNLEDALNTLSDYEEIKKVSDALEEKRNALEESEMRWMELSEKMEG